MVSVWLFLWVNGKPLEKYEWRDQTTGLIFAQDPSGSHVCNRRQQGWKQTHQPEGLAKIQVRDDGRLDQSSDCRGGGRHSDASAFYVALNLPRACAGRHIFIVMTIA